MKKEKVVTAKTSNSIGRYLILSVIMLFIGAGGLYLLIYFFYYLISINIINTICC